MEEIETEDKVILKPTLYVILIDDTEQSHNLDITTVAKTMVSFSRMIRDNQEESKRVGSQIDDAISHIKDKMDNYNAWLENPDIYVIKASTEQKDDLAAIVCNDMSGTDLVIDDYIDDDYTFSVENRMIAKMLIKSNEEMTVVGEDSSGRVYIKKPEITASYIFTNALKDVIDNYVKEKHLSLEKF